MMLLTGANNATYRKLMREQPNSYGWFVQPRAYYRNKLSTDERIRWGMDNDAFKDFHAQRFFNALEYFQPYKDRCLFVVCPDSLSDHKQTLVRWWEWQGLIKYFGFPVAFVAQDGLCLDEVPWAQMDALFVGGSDQFKDRESHTVIQEAQKRGLWVHVGRVNDSESRLRYCLSMGVDSIDGTAFAYKPSKMLKWYIGQLDRWARQGKLL